MWKMGLQDPIFEAGSTTKYYFCSLTYFWNIFHSYFSLVSLQWNYIIKVVNDTYSQQPKDYIYRVTITSLQSPFTLPYFIDR